MRWSRAVAQLESEALAAPLALCNRIANLAIFQPANGGGGHLEASRAAGRFVARWYRAAASMAKVLTGATRSLEQDAVRDMLQLGDFERLRIFEEALQSASVQGLDLRPGEWDRSRCGGPTP